MKKLITILILTLVVTLNPSGQAKSKKAKKGKSSKSSKPGYNLIVIDSSFAPIKYKKLTSKRKYCYVLKAEVDGKKNTPLAVDKCYDHQEWNEVKKEDVTHLRGLLDTWGKVESANSKKWQIIQTKYAQSAQAVESSYKLATHGSLMQVIAYRASNQTAKILPVRVKTLTHEAMKNAYIHQLTKLLRTFTSIKVILLPFRLTRNWMRSVYTGQKARFIQQEFDLIKKSWMDFFAVFSDRIFIVSAGDENQNFDEPQFQGEDLWGSLYQVPNLLIVGSMTSDGKKHPVSNYGQAVKLFALREQISVNAPLPLKNITGHPTKVEAAAYVNSTVAGLLVKMLKATKGGDTKQSLSKLIAFLQADRSTRVIQSYIKSCMQVEKSTKPLECLSYILTILKNKILWGDVNANFVEGKKNWKYGPFPVEFDVKMEPMAQLKLSLFKNEYVPTLKINKIVDPLEFLLVLSHEIHKYARIHKAHSFFHDSSLLKNCISAYKLEVLRNEVLAIYNDLRFWIAAPEWFKEHLNNRPARLVVELGDTTKSEVTYKQYFKTLAKMIKKDKFAIVKHLVNIEGHPACAIGLLATRQ
ncbi:MAG: hypothetical protein ISR65_13110 [Bacteriovoracaceae bacterium]|nr:hypothetical protein [Bacteriovoracaceae bacterium]